MSISFRRFWAMFRARNREFFRDRAAFGWNFLFPFLIVAGFALIFSGGSQKTYKIGVAPVSPAGVMDPSRADIPAGFKTVQYAEFIGFDDMAVALDRLRHHKIDILIAAGPPPYRYWVSDASPNGYVMAALFRDSLQGATATAVKEEIHGREIRYIDWLFPGILGMNMMFSALWGVGYVVVRYRKNGVLRRFKATPLTAVEYLGAQLLSRVFLLMFTLTVVWLGSDLVFSFRVAGRFSDIFLTFFLGSLSMTGLGLILAARGTSEEFTSGVLNFISWPMMFLSEVWFSLEGAPEWLRATAKIFPLTHMLSAVRRIMNDGAGLWDIWPELAILGAMTIVFLGIGASLFSWTR